MVDEQIFSEKVEFELRVN